MMSADREPGVYTISYPEYVRYKNHRKKIKSRNTINHHKKFKSQSYNTQLVRRTIPMTQHFTIEQEWSQPEREDIVSPVVFCHEDTIPLRHVLDGVSFFLHRRTSQSQMS